MSASRCVPAEDLAAFAAGTLERGRADGVRAHVGHCEECRSIVAELVRGTRQEAVDGSAAAISDRLALAHIAPGTVIAKKYRVESLIAEGGMGRVFRATHVGLGSSVAVKVMRPELATEERGRRRFLREARAAAALASESAVRILDVDELVGGLPYLVMELLDGQDLATVVHEQGPCEPHTAARWLAQACEALAEAHARGIVHRDVKPHNLVLTRRGTVKVVDFGLALAPADESIVSRSVPGAVVGSPMYMSPEQLRGDVDVDARADVWSVGATMYHLVTGAPPFAGPSFAVLCARILSQDPPPVHARRREVPEAIADVIMRCLRRDREARFATANALRHALLAATEAEEMPPTRMMETARAPVSPSAALRGRGADTAREEDLATEKAHRNEAGTLKDAAPTLRSASDPPERR